MCSCVKLVDNMCIHRGKKCVRLSTELPPIAIIFTSSVSNWLTIHTTTHSYFAWFPHDKSSILQRYFTFFPQFTHPLLLPTPV